MLKNNVFQLGFPSTSPISRSMQRKGFIGVEERRLCRWENVRSISKMLRGAKSEKWQLAEESDLVFAIATSHKVWLIRRKHAGCLSAVLIHWQRSGEKLESLVPISQGQVTSQTCDLQVTWVSKYFQRRKQLGSLYIKSEPNQSSKRPMPRRSLKLKAIKWLKNHPR